MKSRELNYKESNLVTKISKCAHKKEESMDTNEKPSDGVKGSEIPSPLCEKRWAQQILQFKTMKMMN